MNRPEILANDSPNSGADRLNFFICFSILTALTLKFYLIFRLKIQWDEFFFLSHVHTYIRSSVDNKFQNFYIHFFQWLPRISDNEVDQIIFARILMYFLMVGSSIYTYLIGRQFVNRAGAFFSLLCYLSLSNLVVHGASFRADSICSFLFLFVVYHLIKQNQSKLSALAAGLAMAVALMVSIKSAFYLMVIMSIFVLKYFSAQQRPALSKEAIQFHLSFSLIYAGLYGWHSKSINVASTPQAGEFLNKVFTKVILTEHVFPGRYYFISSLCENPFVWIYLIIGIYYLNRSRESVTRSDRHLLMWSFLILLTPLLFYRNSFPYFYVFIISPAILFCGILMHNVTKDFHDHGARAFLIFAYIFSFSVFGNFLFHFTSNVKNQTGPQRQLLAAVHEIFPAPVPYIDGCSALGSFPKIGIFMSSWGMENYHAAGRPIFRDLLVKERPVFLLANIPYLDLSLPREKQLTSLRYPLMENDWDVLRTNFIHHWGILYVLGKNFKFNAAGESENFEILVSGEYTLESEGSVFIDGLIYHNGDMLHLDQGNHTIHPQSGPMNAILRWGKDLPKPSIPPLSFPLFYT